MLHDYMRARTKLSYCLPTLLFKVFVHVVFTISTIFQNIIEITAKLHLNLFDNLSASIVP